MYRKKDRTIQQQIQFVTLEDMVSSDHILRDIDRAIDFNFIYEEVEGLYAPLEMGRPGIDPVSLFKIIFIQYLFGIRSMRQTIREIDVNMAYRWFIGYGLTEPISHFSTFSKNYAAAFRIQTSSPASFSVYCRKQPKPASLTQAPSLSMAPTLKPVQTRTNPSGSP